MVEMKRQIVASFIFVLLTAFPALSGCAGKEAPPLVDTQLQSWVDNKAAELELSDILVLAEHDWRVTPTEESGRAYFNGKTLAASVRLHDISQTEKGTVVLLSTLQANRMYFRFLLDERNQSVLQRPDRSPVYIDSLPGSDSGTAATSPTATAATYRILLRVNAVSKEVVSLKLCSDQQAGYDPQIGLAPSYVFEGVCLVLASEDVPES